MPRKHELDPNLPFELGLFFLMGRTNSKGCSLWGQWQGAFPMLRGVLGVSGSQCQDRVAVLWVRTPAWAIREQEVLLGEAHYTVGVQFFIWVGDGLPAWKQHILDITALCGCGWQVLGRVWPGC